LHSYIGLIAEHPPKESGVGLISSQVLLVLWPVSPRI
jgi:hypothetical protein